MEIEVKKLSNNGFILRFDETEVLLDAKNLQVGVQMTRDQLLFQAQQLLGRDVVYTVRCNDGTNECRAGNLVEFPDGLYIRNSERLDFVYDYGAQQVSAHPREPVLESARTVITGDTSDGLILMVVSATMTS